MDSCRNQASWFAYWKENMEALGFPIPDNWLANSVAVFGFVCSVVLAAEKYGEKVTVSELIGAGLLSERWAFWVLWGLRSLLVLPLAVLLLPLVVLFLVARRLLM